MRNTTIPLPTRATPAHVRLQGDPSRCVSFPEDRAYWEVQNRREFEQKLAAGTVRRRPASK